MNKGKVSIPMEYIIEKKLQTLKELFKVFYPIDINHNHSLYAYDSIMFYGYSDLFEHVEEGQIAPEYVATFHRHKNGNVRFVKFEKLDYSKSFF